MLGQRRRRLTGIEPAIGSNAGPTLNRNLVDRPTSSLMNDGRMAMVVEGIHVEDIFGLVSLVLSLIISTLMTSQGSDTETSIFKFIYLFIETYLYRVDSISSQAIFHMCPVVILLYENNNSIIQYIIYR